MLLFSHSIVSNSLRPPDPARQVPLSFTTSCNLLKLMSIELAMSSNHLVLCRPLLLLPSISPSNRVFSSELALRIRWPYYCSFNFSNSPSNEIQDWFPWVGTGSIFLQSKGLSRIFSSTIWKPQFFSTQPSLCPALTSVHDYWKNHSFD